ncbi:MAG TPA: hypothetical protein VLG28_11725 [Acidimicrobiia bacterium]|jgi:hypothetical protein|nr:hypothetical protein [Acidimicrobiia bacterium]
MFDVYCPQHGSRVLLGYSAIDSVANTDTGIHVRFRCDCGYRGVWVTGNKAHKSH